MNALSEPPSSYVHFYETQLKSCIIRKLEITDGKFLLDGKPFVFVCGEIHYNRIPRELWRDRLHKARAMGINCISAYVFWNFHERSPGQFDFSANADIAEFIRIAHNEGLLVYLRPGPYVCAEYDFGGYPQWLQNIPGIKWRSRDPMFIELMDRYIQALSEQLKGLQLSKGGPIAFVQVENEYGSYGEDKVYLASIRDMMRKHGFDALLTTCDEGDKILFGKVEGCLPTINGALGASIKSTIDIHHPGGPYFVSEFYPAWFDVWGKPHSVKDLATANGQFSWMLDHGISVSIYMFHGGTNFWHTNGANNQDGKFEPQPTSYDYDAPLGEYGNMTPKYMAFRDAVLSARDKNPDLSYGPDLPPIPQQPKVVTVPSFNLVNSSPLSSVFRQPTESDSPLTMEALSLDFGYLLYRTRVAEGKKGILDITQARDFVWVYINGNLKAKLDRRHNQHAVEIDIPNGATVEILVENVGRINYGPSLLDNLHGLINGVTFAGIALTGWEHFPLPLYREGTKISSLPFGPAITNAPAFHRGYFEVSELGEIFLDFGAWGKGAVWVNGRSLGKFWAIGPQQTLYLPSAWVKVGLNEIVVLELDDRGMRSLQGLPTQILDKLQLDRETVASCKRVGIEGPRLDAEDLLVETSLAAGGQSQTIGFSTPVSARYIAVQIGSSHGDTPYASIANIQPLDSQGRLIRGSSILYVNSEELSGENGRAENVLDGNPYTIWHTQWERVQPNGPHTIVIDLGYIHRDILGLHITNRESHTEGAANRVMIYARSQTFLIDKNR